MKLVPRYEVLYQAKAVHSWNMKLEKGSHRYSVTESGPRRNLCCLLLRGNFCWTMQLSKHFRDFVSCFTSLNMLEINIIQKASGVLFMYNITCLCRNINSSTRLSKHLIVTTCFPFFWYFILCGLHQNLSIKWVRVLLIQTDLICTQYNVLYTMVWNIPNLAVNHSFFRHDSPRNLVMSVIINPWDMNQRDMNDVCISIYF